MASLDALWGRNGRHENFGKVIGAVPTCRGAYAPVSYATGSATGKREGNAWPKRHTAGPKSACVAVGAHAMGKAV